MKELKVEVARIKERCGAKLKVGDTFYIRGKGTLDVPEGQRLCLYALQGLIPFLLLGQQDRSAPGNEWIPDLEELCCPDARGVVFKITPISK